MHSSESSEASTPTKGNPAQKGMTFHGSAIPIRPVVKDYAWGIRGMDSRVA